MPRAVNNQRRAAQNRGRPATRGAARRRAEEEVAGVGAGGAAENANNQEANAGQVQGAGANEGGNEGGAGGGGVEANNADDHQGVGLAEGGHNPNGNGGNADAANHPLPPQNGQLPNGITYSVSFLEKLKSFGLADDKACIIVENGVTTPFTFARFFDKAALKDLFGDDYGLAKTPLLVKQKVKVFHRWLQNMHKEGEDLNGIDLERFDNQAMATLLEEDPEGGVVCGQSNSIKDSGMQLPVFNGNQPAYAIWHAKWRNFLSNMKNEEGLPLLYIIVNPAEEKPANQKQIKAVKWSGKEFERDNFKVAQWLETALADGTAHVYAKKHPGDTCSAFADLHKTYQSESKSETKIREIHNKLKTLQYRGAKNFGWDKFTNTLQGYYQELVTLVNQ